MKNDIYTEITNLLIDAIENSEGKFKMPWQRSGAPLYMPQNAISKRDYNGVNTLVLWAMAEKMGYSSGQWATFKQWKDAGGNIRKGEKASPIIFYKELEHENKSTGETEKRWWGRKMCVFNIDQVEGMASNNVEPIRFDPITRADALLTATGATINETGQQAYYNSASDEIFLPERGLFRDTETSTAQNSFYAVALHELTHWTGAESRLNRELKNRFGDEKYAAEELIAEIGSAFLCGQLGITNEPRADHAHYLAHWLKILKADKKAIFTAASAASKAAKFILSHEQEEQALAA